MVRLKQLPAACALAAAALVGAPAQAQISGDTITVLQRGATLAEGPYAEVSKNPAVIEAYMGSANVELKGAH